MDALLVGDLHLTSQPRDEYRWDIFAQLDKLIAQRDPTRIILLGDLTDEKDRHSAQLVNRVCDSLAALASGLPSVDIVRGNHDGLDPSWPYFRFLNLIKGLRFHIHPTLLSPLSDVLILPHSRDPEKDWKNVSFKGISTVLAHITVDGAESESGVELGGLRADYFSSRGVKRVYAGDVHVPQQIGCVTYVGAPYPIRFGDKFKPRVLHVENDKAVEIPLRSPHRLMLDIEHASDLNGLVFDKGAQAKIRLHLPEDKLGGWIAERKTVIEHCKSVGLDLIEVSLVKKEGARPASRIARGIVKVEEILSTYIKKHRVGKSYAEVGQDLLEEVKK